MAELQLSFLGFPILAFVCGVGLFLLSLCYLERNTCFPVFWKQRDINQHQGRAKRRRKGRILKGWRACQSEVEDARKVLSLLQSPLGQHDDTTRFRQLLCPDTSCEVCNNASAEVSRLLFPEALEDATSSVSSLASTAPVTDSSFIQSKSISILSKPVLEKSSSDSPDGFSTCVPTIRGTEHSGLSSSDFSWWKAHVNKMFLPTLPHSDIQQEHVSFHLPETCLCRDSVTKDMEASSHSFLGLNIQALMKRQIKKRMAFQNLEKKEKEEGPFSKQMWSEYQRTSSRNSLKSLDIQDTVDPQTDSNVESKSEQLHICQQLLYVKTLGGNLQQKYSQLFWGLPSLHSESLVATLLVSSSSSPLESHFVLFNGVCNGSSVKMHDQESPPHLHSHPLPLPHVHPQPLPQTKPKSQPLPFTQVQPQVNLQSRLPILPSSPPSQIRDCGVSFHRLQNESDFHIATENQHLEWHVLQKQQESLWGLVPMLHKSQEATCPRALNLPLVNQSSHACVPVSIIPDHFHITSEPQEKLELHVPRRLIPRWCLQACRNLESLALMEPQYKLIEVSQQRGRHVHLQLSELNGQHSKDLGMTELGLPGSFHERVPTKFQLRDDMRKNLGYILEKSPEDRPQGASECYLVQGLRPALGTQSNCVCNSRNHSSYELLNVSRKDIDRNQIKTILRLHVSTKSWQISAGRIPVGVCRSWLAEDNTLPPSRSSQTNMEDANSENTKVARAYCQTSTLELSFLNPNTRKVLEAHILRFRVTQRWGLPLKVLESIKFYMLREAKTWPLPQFDFPSSTTHVSGADSKTEISKPLEGSSTTSQGKKMRTTNSVPMLAHPLSVISSVGNEGQGAPQPSHSDFHQKLTEDVRTTDRGRQAFQSITHRNKDKVGQSETLVDNRCSPEVPRRQSGDGHEPRNKNVYSSDRVEMIQVQKTVEKNLEHSFMSNMSREIFKANELCALKSQSCDISTTRKVENSQRTNVKMNKVGNTLTTQCPSPKTSVRQDSKLSDLEKQLITELKFKLESQKHSQAQCCPTDVPLTSHSLPSKLSLTHAQGISTGATAASQVPRVRLENSGVSMEQWQDPSKHALWMCQDNNFPSTAKRMSPLGSKAGEYRSGDSEVGTSKTRKKSHPIEDRELKDTFPSWSQDEQLPPESYFRKKMRQFFQWINSKRKIKAQGSPQQKAKFKSTFVQHQASVESASGFVSYGHPEAQELMMAIGKILEEKLACMLESEASEFRQHKKELQTQRESDKGHASSYRAVLDPQQKGWASTKSSNQEAVSADQSCLTSVRQNRDMITQPQKVAFEN